MPKPWQQRQQDKPEEVLVFQGLTSIIFSSLALSGLQNLSPYNHLSFFSSLWWIFMETLAVQGYGTAQPRQWQASHVAFLHIIMIIAGPSTSHAGHPHSASPCPPTIHWRLQASHFQALYTQNSASLLRVALSLDAGFPLLSEPSRPCCRFWPSSLWPPLRCVSVSYMCFCVALCMVLLHGMLAMSFSLSRPTAPSWLATHLRITAAKKLSHIVSGGSHTHGRAQHAKFCPSYPTASIDSSRTPATQHKVGTGMYSYSRRRRAFWWGSQPWSILRWPRNTICVCSWFSRQGHSVSRPWVMPSCHFIWGLDHLHGTSALPLATSWNKLARGAGTQARVPDKWLMRNAMALVLLCRRGSDFAGRWLSNPSPLTMSYS